MRSLSANSIGNYSSRDLTSSATNRPSLTSSIAAKLFQAVGYEEETSKDLGIFEEPMHDLHYSVEDVVNIVADDRSFRALQKKLRQRGCVTNTFLQQNLHFYVRNLKDRRASRVMKKQERLGTCAAA